MTLHRLYRYVGPVEIAERAREAPPGLAVTDAATLARAVAALASPRQARLTVTYVVDARGVLRIADRASEHVACAGGGPVMAAGELTLGFDTGGPSVTAATNLSTGFCPEVSCAAA